LPAYKTGFRVAGTVSSISFSEGVRSAGTIDPIVLNEQFRIDGQISPIPYRGPDLMQGIYKCTFNWLFLPEGSFPPSPWSNIGNPPASVSIRNWFAGHYKVLWMQDLEVAGNIVVKVTRASWNVGTLEFYMGKDAVYPGSFLSLRIYAKNSLGVVREICRLDLMESYFRFFFGATYDISTPAPVPNTMYHIRYSWDISTGLQSFWIDGVQKLNNAPFIITSGWTATDMSYYQFNSTGNTISGAISHVSEYPLDPSYQIGDNRIPLYGGASKIIGTISSIPKHDEIRVGGSISYVPLKSEMRVEGILDGFDHVTRIRSVGFLIGNFVNSKTRCIGWTGTRPRRPPYDLRMTLDHHIRRMRGTVKLYHFPPELETHDHQALVKSSPVEYDLTGYVFFARDRMTAIEARREGIVDIFTAHMVIDSSKLPAGLPSINEKHDIIEYVDEATSSLKYRFREHGISFEEWHGLIEYRLVSMGRGRQFGLYRRIGVKSTGTIIGELFDSRARMQGLVALVKTSQIKISGEILWHLHSEQIGIHAITIPIPYTHNMKVEGYLEWIPYHHNMRVEGYLDWAVNKTGIRCDAVVDLYHSRMRIDGYTSIPVRTGFRVVGETEESFDLMLYSMLEQFAVKNGYFISAANQTAIPPISGMVQKFQNPFNVFGKDRTSCGMNIPQWKQGIYAQELHMRLRMW
jgi:hypothetical protein